MTTTATIRTIEQANDILRAEGAVSWIGLSDPERLGCDPADHERWLRTATEREVRMWARSVAADEPDADA